MERLRWIGRLGSSLLVVAAIVTASAWQGRADDQYVGVARISVVGGAVVLQHADSADKIAAIVNAPVMLGDYVTTGADSRTEVQLDDTDFVRAAGLTQMRFTQLDPTLHTVQLAAGTIELSVLRYPESHPQIQTPSITIRPADTGGYRVSVTDAGDTLVTVRSGRVDLVSPQGTQSLGAGTSVLVAGPSSAPRFQTIAYIAYDSFDTWNGERNRFIASALAAGSYATSAYANSGIVGLTDLNGYGSWSNYPAYGNVWIPYGQVAGWSPYRYGRWAWQPYCGWTWIGYEPWGWAPYHYGRWFYGPNRGWAWYPGPAYNRYYWQPGLVAFFGFGGGGGFNLGFNFSFGNVGWVPLAPYEAYHPWWGRGYAAGPTIFHRDTDVTKVYRNAGAPGGIAAIHGNEFSNGTKYQYIPVHESDLHAVALAKSGLPVAPSNDGYRYASASGDVARVAPISNRFSALSQPTLPAIVLPQRSATQTVATLPVASHTNTIARTGSADVWDRFGSGNTVVTVVHTMNGTQTLVSSAPAHAAPGSNAWSRFDSMTGSKAISASAPAANAGGTNGWTTPVTHASSSGSYAPAYDASSHFNHVIESHPYVTSPNSSGSSAAGSHQNGGLAPAPVHGNGGNAHGSGASSHSGNGH